MPAINTVEQFDAALAHGPWAWPGGYPLFFVCADGEALSFASAQVNAELVRSAIRDHDNRDWRVCAVEINWEDEDLFCADSGKQIESAYGDSHPPKGEVHDD